MPAQRRRELFPLSSYTQAQRDVIAGLMKLYPERPWWLLVKNPGAPAGCTITDGLCLRFDHPYWVAGRLPCLLPGCNCTIWAITPLEAFYQGRRSVPFGGRATNCCTCCHWQPEVCALRYKDFPHARYCVKWEREPGSDDE